MTRLRPRRAEAGGLPEGWVTLIDPLTRRSFYWHTRMRTRRLARPAADDNGSLGAGDGDEEHPMTPEQVRAPHA